MSLFAELQRRNVIRVGIAYVVVAWVIAQVAEFAFENFGAPDWVLKSVTVLLLLGLPLVLIFAWAYEMTPEGIKLEKDVDRSASITTQTGRKLDRTIIVVLLVALAWFAWDKFVQSDTPAPTTAEATSAAEDAVADSAAETPDKSVAVLPFVAMSDGPDDEYFADGLTEEILNSLAQLPELLVTARTSAFSFKGQDMPVQEIAATLGVQHIVEGSVRRSGERLRVTAQLIRADDGFHLWSENYDSTSADMISVQENIAEKIAGALDIYLDDEKREAMRRAGLRNPEAFTLYQKGLDIYGRAHGDMEDQLDGLRQANEYFEQVIELVPEFSEAYVNHSDFYVHYMNDAVTGELRQPFTKASLDDAYQSALSDIEAASRFAPTARQRYLVELDQAFLSGNWRGLEGRLKKALDEPGCYDGNWTATVANVLGYSAEYFELARKVRTCDPLRSLSWFNEARAKFWAGDAGEALQLAREGSETAPGTWLTMTLVQTMVANRLHDEAHGVIDQQVHDENWAGIFHLMVEAHRGDPDRTAPFAEELRQSADTGFWTVLAAAWLGEKDIANQTAAAIDEYESGPMALWQLAHWCQCGAPWELEVTPRFAAKIRDGNVPWPPNAPLTYPLKNW